MEQTLFEASKYKLIYVFGIKDQAHSDCVKIGEATIGENLDSEQVLKINPDAGILKRYANARIKQYTQTAGVAFQLHYTETAVYEKDGVVEGFTDHKVHDVLLRSGIKRKEFSGVSGQGTEWFITDVETAKNAIKAVKEGRKSLRGHEVTTDQSPIIFRPEQREAINCTKKQFKKGNQMLWNAKMRFGKTLSALQVIKEMEVKRTLIYTHRPDVEKGWYDDFLKIFYDTDGKYIFGSRNKGEVFSNLENVIGDDGHIIFFASLQDLRGSEIVGGKFNKNDEIFTTPWDLIIVDEAHEGTLTDHGKAVLAELLGDETKVLRLSGTPFNLLDDFKDDEIYTWDYVMEQRAKRDWDLTHFGDPNPYTTLPTMHIYTYDLGRLMNEFIDEEVAFNFREFFRVNDDDGEFIHKKDIEAFLNLLVKDDKDNGSCYPFANEPFRDIFRHTLWTVPGVQAAKALSKMLQKHEVFQHFNIVNVAGEGDEEEERKKALEKVEKAIGSNPDETYTITLTCGRLTTGVTVPAWTGVLMLSGSYSTSASSYMQTIFRVQSPATYNGHTKEDCYVFDFAPDRTLQVLATVPRVSTKAGKTTEGQKRLLAELLNFMSVISIEGSEMKANNMTPEKMLQHLKRAYIEKVVQSGFENAYLYNDELLKLSDIELKEFENLGKIIGRTKALGNVGNIEINKQGLTDEQYAEMQGLEKKKKKKVGLTEEEKKRLEELKKAKEGRDKAVSILRSISIRMPLLIYGAEIKDENKELTIDNFTELIDELSWKEFMPNGITKEEFKKFKKYYDPEIFSAAGKRIRSLARSADKMPIEERIERITGIFATLRNPDKETVLTPWRVVNMHIGDTLGGYCFYKEGYNEAILDPRYIDHGEITDEVFAPDTHLLEINSKTGLYPLYLAYNVYRRRLKELTTSPQTLEEHLKVWDKVVAENIFVICKTPMAKSITRRTLVGFRNAKVNTRFFEDLINQIRNKPDNFLAKVVQGKKYWKANNNDNMKFNAIVGNPPYQEMDGGAAASAVPVYNNFVNIAKRIKPNFISMIMPARWYAGGKGLDDFRTSMLNDTHISSLFDYANSKDIFPTVEIAGGICYFIYDASYEGKCNIVNCANGRRNAFKRSLDCKGVFVRDNYAIEIIEKVSAVHNSTQYLDKIVSSRNVFSLASNIRGHENEMQGDVKLLSSQGVSYIERNKIKANTNLIDRYKVIVTYAMSGGNKPNALGQYQILSSLIVLKPNEICTETFLIIDDFSDYEEANNLRQYLSTKFSRYLLLQSLSSIHITKASFRFVPLQDFTDKSDIDWSQSVADIDQQLYKKYGLSEDEQQFIESMIKPM